tara:strand:- start:178 stop:324 length:147 start_codon:yes stop_codon:yes gene_type:complete
MISRRILGHDLGAFRRVPVDVLVASIAEDDGQIRRRVAAAEQRVDRAT